MQCPGCGGVQLHVIDTREVLGGRRRRYECLVCGSRLSTLEVPMETLAKLKKEIKRLGSQRTKGC